MGSISIMGLGISLENTSNASVVGDPNASSACLLLDLPEDVLSLLSLSLSPRDLCNLSLACKKLHLLCKSEKLWWSQCKLATDGSSIDLESWWSSLPCYKSIFRFIKSVKPLLGIWVHQNPELGNLVYVKWGFLSVVGCRIIPQELGSRGFDTGLLWAPVFEIIANNDGSSAFFLHGRENDRDCCYPGCFDGARDDCNVLLLEAEPRPGSSSSNVQGSSLAEADDENSLEDTRKLIRSGAKLAKLKTTADSGSVQFQKLHFADRRKMLDAVARQVRLKIPQPVVEPIFPRKRNIISLDMDPSSTRDQLQKETLQLSERRCFLIKMYRHGDPNGRRPPTSTHYNGINSNYLLDKICNPADYTNGLLNLKLHGDGEIVNRGIALESLASTSASMECPDSPTSSSSLSPSSQPQRRQKLSKIIREKMKYMMGMVKNDEMVKANESEGNSSVKRILLLQQFTRQGDTVALCLHARHWDLKTYRAWPLMPDNRFALYKMPEQKPVKGREHAGLWGGTFGWPPGRPTEEKPNKALYFLLLSYDNTDQGRVLIATKILEGTHYVLHPNGSPMFTAYVDEPSSQEFPWHTDKDGMPVDIIQAYHGEGIANGYGFRYPSSKPGDLFVAKEGLLAFVWRESQNVLTLQRLNLEVLLGRGDRVAALAPIANYAYLIKSLSNVFAGFCGFANRSKHELPTVESAS